MRYSRLIETVASSITVFYGGRFQPMHIGHFQVYQDLVEEFGYENVFISTMLAKDADIEDNPFTFEEKQMIMTEMFGIPKNHIINTHPYTPDITLTGRNPADTAFILVFSAKDEGRFTENEYLRSYRDDIDLSPSTEAGYIYVADIKDDGRSSTTFRNAMRMDEVDDDKKREIFTDFFGDFDEEMYNFILEKLNGY